jgi:AcrR family transcriptional regulator
MAKRLNRSEKKARTRNSLLEAAARAFPLAGYHGTSVEQIAEEAGFSKGAVYSNFESKEDLFLAVFTQYLRRNLAITEEQVSADKPIDEQARESARIYTTRADENREWRILFMEFWVAAARDPELRRKVAAHYAEFRAEVAEIVLRRAKEQGIPILLSPEQVATAAVALNEGFILQHFVDPEEISEQSYGTLLSLFYESIAALNAQIEAKSLKPMQDGRPGA